MNNLVVWLDERIKIGDVAVRLLMQDVETYFGDAELRAPFGGNRCVRHARGVAYERLHASEAFAQSKESPGGSDY